MTEGERPVNPWEPETPGRVKQLMFVNRRAPHGTIYALESLEAVLAAAAFDQDVTVVFVDDGVYQLKRHQHTEAVGIRDFSRTYGALESYGVGKVYVEQASLEARGLKASDLVIPVEVVSTDQLARVMASQDVVISA